MANCYLCGEDNATNQLNLKDTFTAHSLAKSPQSSTLCDRCAWVIPLRCFYWNSTKNKYSILFSRNWSWLVCNDLSKSQPKFLSPITEGKDTLPVVENLPTRLDLRSWLLNPPQPPFTIAIAESGQKHIYPWAQSAQSRDYFPVQFELDTIYINRLLFSEMLNCYERLMQLGFSKTEINSGFYRSDKLKEHISTYLQYESVIASIRGSLLLNLLSYVAIDTTKVIDYIGV